MSPQQRAVDTAAAIPWLAWYFAHINDINSVLQTICLIVGILSGLATFIYHVHKRWRR